MCKEGRGTPRIMAKRTSGVHEPLSVPTDELADVLMRWINEHDALYPHEDEVRVELGKRAQNSGYNDEPWGFSGRRYVAEWSGLLDRTLYRVLARESKFTALSVADELLTAIERTDLLGKEVRVVPNPLWTQERWVEVMSERGCGDFDY